MFFLSAQGEGLKITFRSCGFSGLPTVAVVNHTWDFRSFENMWVLCSALLPHLVIRAQGQQGKCLTVHADLQFVHKRFSAVFSAHDLRLQLH